MKAIVDAIRDFEIMRGTGVKEPALGEASTRVNNRKSIVLLKHVAAGEALTLAHLSIKRPGYGIAPKFYEQLAGRRTLRDLAADDVLKWEDLQ